MKKIFRKNKKTNLLKHSYRPCDFTQNWSDSEHTQSSQTCNNGRFRMTLFRGLQTATLTLAMSFFITSPAIAQQVPVPTLDKLNKDGVTIPDSDPEQVYPESAYKLTPIENADPENLPQNAITLYDKTEVIKYYDPQTGQEVAADDRLPDVQYKEITTIQTTPKYYTVELKQTQYGNPSGTESITYGWEKTAEGTLEFKENHTNPQGQTITYKYTETGFSETETHQKDLGTIENPSGTFANPAIIQGGAALNNPTGKTDSIDNVLFKDNSTTGKVISTTSGRKYADVLGGAVYNEGTISSVTGAFINNSLDITTEETSGYLSVYAKGGAIYNSGTIGDMTADFVGNYVSGDYYVYGGAIYNSAETGNITGNFIGNYATGSSYAYGGAIYNNNGTIGDITGDFIGNYVSVSGFYNANGGAIYNSAEMGNITGNFIGNYASGSSSAYGGAIYNDEGTIGDITGDFIGNYASGSSSAYGGAIYNWDGTIGDITGDFIGNYVSSTDTYSSSFGGAIYNNRGTIGNITGDFIGNSAKNAGGAIYNSGRIGNITGDFIGNNANYGGAIDNSGTIGNITGDFIGNNANYGGAIDNSGTISNITGDFIANKGTAVYNKGTITNLTGNFVNNKATAIKNQASGPKGHTVIENIKGNFINNTGGAIYNNSYEGAVTIGNINANFINNNNSASGGAIYNSNKSRAPYGYAGISSMIIDTIKDSNFINNSTEENGGAIFNEDYHTHNLTNVNNIINSNFVGNHAALSGGAIYTNNSINIIAQDRGQSVFSGNYTESAGIKDQNAIYVETDNYSDTYTDRNVIFIENNKVTYEEVTKAKTPPSAPTLTLNANTNGVIVFDDTIDGNVIMSSTTTTQKTGDLVVSDDVKDSWGISTIDEVIEYVKEQGLVASDTPDEEILKIALNQNAITIANEQTVSTETVENTHSYTLAITGDSTGKVVLNNDVINANISLDSTNLYLGREDVFDKSVSLSLNSGSIYMNNQSVGTMHIPTLNLNGNTNISVDADLANKSMDRITADNYNVKDGAMLNVNNVVLLSDAKEDVTNIQFADDGLAANVAYTGASPIAYSPIWKYDVSYNPEDGFFSFARGSAGDSGSYNPSVLASPVATQTGAYITQLQTFNYAFQHADSFMNIPYMERLSIINSGRYALSPTGDATDVGTFSPLLLKDDDAGFWVKPYASFENVPLKNGPKVSNINYGTLVGYDSKLTSVGNGFERVLTGYIGYNGASQRYSGVDAYQNGGLLGGTATFYKGNFFNATTLSVGATAGDASTMYGSENYTMLLAGLGNKTGYNFEFFNGGMILQPSMLISYTFVNTFDYNNAAGVRIESDPMHAIQLAPGIKLIGNTKNGWQPYIGVSMVWNLLDESKVTADSVRLPEMSIKPYVQYGVGIQKRFKDKFLAFGQAMIHNGGRNGVSLSGGLRWIVGRE